MKIMALLAALIFITASASAFTVESPNNVFVFESEKEITIRVFNDSSVQKSLDVKFYSPAHSELIGVQEKIQADSHSSFSIRLLPREDLAGQTYESTLEIELGNTKIIRKIDISFKKPSGESSIIMAPVPPVSPDFNAIGAGFATLGMIGMENALNIVLGIIAAVLLIAFIARFLRRLK